MLAGPWAWYMDRLRAAPLPTKCLTSAVLGLVGDGVAQLHEERTRARNTGAGQPRPSRSAYNVRRGLTIFFDGLLVCAPLQHVGYAWLEAQIPVTDHPRLPAAAAAAAHVLVDDYVFDAVFIALMFFTTGLGEGYPPGQILSQLKEDYVTSVTAMWKMGVVLMPLEFCMFRYLPLCLRVLGMNVVELLWDAMASFYIHKRRREDAREAGTGKDAGRKPQKLPSDMYP